ncbi:hypothetical protein HDV00_007564 [Rhizophlyctis rosea]|nr:hypothetical protein HDV00_007564 [Rhizophlyctis rosea]
MFLLDHPNELLEKILERVPLNDIPSVRTLNRRLRTITNDYVILLLLPQITLSLEFRKDRRLPQWNFYNRLKDDKKFPLAICNYIIPKMRRLPPMSVADRRAYIQENLCGELHKRANKMLMAAQLGKDWEDIKDAKLNTE